MEDHVCPFKVFIITNGNEIYQYCNASCYKAKILQESE